MSDITDELKCLKEQILSQSLSVNVHLCVSRGNKRWRELGLWCGSLHTGRREGGIEGGSAEMDGWTKEKELKERQ